MSVSIVVPLFGPEHFFTACMRAIDENTDGHYGVIVVDNGTGYDMDCVPNPQAIVRNGVNQGFAVACNQGARCSTSSTLLFLNVDTEVQPNWLPPLIAAFDDPGVAMAGPRIVHPAGDLQTAGIRTWHGIGHAGGEEIKQDLPTRDVDGVTGACMAIRRDVFNEFGGFDTAFYNGYDDVDLCLSLSEKGYRIRYVAESQIVHHESATGSERWARAAQNVQIMNDKWGHR